MISQPQFEHGHYHLYPLIEAALTRSEAAIVHCLINGLRPIEARFQLGMPKRRWQWHLKQIWFKLGHSPFECADGVAIAIAFAPLSEWTPAMQEERKVA
jgi:hypothetical protein